MEFIDLGLSVNWATSNLGTDVPEECGDIFAWGETTPRKTFNSQNYIHKNDQRELPDTLTKEFDAVTTLLGEGYRMPTDSEAKELCELCHWEIITHKKGKYEWKVTGKNGNSIILPASFKESDIEWKVGGFWLSTRHYHPPYQEFADTLSFGKYAFGVNTEDNYKGLSIRPVKIK